MAGLMMRSRRTKISLPLETTAYPVSEHSGNPWNTKHDASYFEYASFPFPPIFPLFAKISVAKEPKRGLHPRSCGPESLFSIAAGPLNMLEGLAGCVQKGMLCSLRPTGGQLWHLLSLCFDSFDPWIAGSTCLEVIGGHCMLLIQIRMLSPLSRFTFLSQATFIEESNSLCSYRPGFVFILFLQGLSPWGSPDYTLSLRAAPRGLAWIWPLMHHVAMMSKTYQWCHMMLYMWFNVPCVMKGHVYKTE